MTRQAQLRRIGIAAVVIGMIVIGSAGIALGAPANGTASPTPSEETTVVERVDDRLRVVGFEFVEGGPGEQSVFRISLSNDGDRASSVTVTEAISRRSANSGKFGIEIIEVDPGETLTVELTAWTDRPLGVLVTTRQSAREGHGTFLERPGLGDGRLIGGEPTGADVRSSGLFGIVGTLGIVGLGAWRRVSREHDDVEAVDMGADR